MDYGRQLASAQRKHAKARAALTETEAERDNLIREAHRDGGLSTREIAGLVDMSHQRVGQILHS